MVLEVVRCVVESHGKQLTAEAATAALGMRPSEAWAAVAKELGIERTGAELYEQSEPLLRDRWVLGPRWGWGRAGAGPSAGWACAWLGSSLACVG